MKRAMIVAAVFGLVAMWTVQASAVSVGPGMLLYSSVGYKTAPTGTSWWTGAKLYRTALDGSWAATESATNFDTIDVPTILAQMNTQYGSMDRIEVWDPRDQGGNGDLFMPLMAELSRKTGEQSGWSVVKIDADTPTNNDAFTKGATGNILVQWNRLDAYASGNTSKMQMALRAPNGFGGQTTTTGINIVTYSETTDGQIVYRYDANGNGWCDNGTTANVEWYAKSGAVPSSPSDMELGLDGAVYVSRAYGAGTSGGVYRTTANGTQMTTRTAFVECDCTIGGSPLYKTNNGSGGMPIAVGGTAATPIVYTACFNDCSVEAIFALVDGSGDGVVDYLNASDKIVQLWKVGDFSITPGFTYNQIFDMEYYKDDNGVQWLVFNAGGQNGTTTDPLYGRVSGLYVLQLGDNGLVATDGMVISQSGYLTGRYFELDANPGVEEIPEPATLLLVGTGALGVIGYMRRRKMS
jgi:hypothetical protein